MRGIPATAILFDASDYARTSLSRRNYDVAPDRQHFLMVQRADSRKATEVVVIEHWAEEVRKRRQ